VKRCQRCVLPGTYPGIVFNEHGVCNRCLSHEPFHCLGEDALRQVLESCRNRGPWDCLVPMSGGSDSTYVAYRLVRDYGMKVLGYHYDNHFIAPIARGNLARIENLLGIEIVRESSRLDTRLKRLFIRLNLHKSPLHLLFAFCHGCPDAIWGGARRIARQKRIPLVISSESREEDASYKRTLWDRVKPSPREKIRWAARMTANFALRKCLGRLLEWRYPRPKSWKNPEKIEYFAYRKQDRPAMLSVLTREVGWEHPSGNYPWRFDCLIHPVVEQMTFNLLGMTEKDDLFSVLIREGQMDRREALTILESWEGRRKEQLPLIEGVLKRLGLDVAERSRVLRYCEKGIWSGA